MDTTPAERIIRKFGSVRGLARALGHANPSTVQGWRERGIIPARQIPKVLGVAERDGLVVSANDFLPMPPEPAPADREVAA